MEHRIIIPYPCQTVRYTTKPLPVWQGLTQIGTATIHNHNKVKVAKSDLNSPYDLIARGKMVIREGDLINEFVIIGFDIKK